MKRLFLVSILLFSFLLLQGQNWRDYQPIAGSDSTIGYTDPNDPNAELQILPDSLAQIGLMNITVSLVQAMGRRYVEFKAIERAYLQSEKWRKDLLPDFPSLVDVSKDNFNRRYSKDGFPGSEATYSSILRIAGDTVFNIEIFHNVNGAQLFRIEGDTTNTTYPLNFVASEIVIRAGSQNKPVPIVEDIIEFHRIPIRGSNNPNDTRKTDRKGWRTFWGQTIDGRLVQLIIDVRWNENLTAN